MKLYSKDAPCFDDILLVPQYSDIESRSLVDISTRIGSGVRSIRLRVPIIAAPMDTICEDKMAIAMRVHGGLGIIHRYMDTKKQNKQVSILKKKELVVGAAVGSKQDEYSRAIGLAESGASLILVDTANGHSKYAITAVTRLRRILGNRVHIMAGNVSTYDAFMRLADAGADSVRVGIGGGAMCTTRIVTGHGMPTLASIIEIKNGLRSSLLGAPSIIADGGIRNSGDAVKALAAGADAVMIGSALAGTNETPGKVITDENGISYKALLGMASKEAQKDWRGHSSVSEGAATLVPCAGPVVNVLDDWIGGIRSGLSYSGANNLEELYNESQFVLVSSNSVSESRPHGVRRS